MNEQMVCKYCQSENVIKYGKYKDTQYYYCNDRKRKKPIKKHRQVKPMTTLSQVKQ